MWLKKANLKGLGFHPVHILEDGSINWELHCGCCSGTAGHFILTPKENQELFQVVDSVDATPSTIKNLLEKETFYPKEKKN